MEDVESTDGTRIAYECIGSGCPLVCVHGTGASSGSLRFFAASFDVLQCVVMDRRGRGESGDTDAHAIDHEVEDLLAVLGIFQDPALFGHSYGGILALEAARRLDGLDGLVLYEPPVLGGDDGESLAAELGALHDDGDGAEVVRRFFDRAVGEDIDDLWPNWETEAPPAHTFVREVAAVERYTLPEALAIDVPTLLVYGEESPQHLRDSTTAIADLLPGARLVELEGIGHNGTSHAPARLAAEFESFLD